jgi:hypothetical protein
MAPLRVGEVQRAYTSLWVKFTQVANDARLAVTGHPDARAKEKTIEGGAFLYFRGWPWKATSAKRTVDILVKVAETFDARSHQITKCTTQVGYFERLANGVEPLLQLHYDFETPVPDAHPVFHAQFGETKWVEADCREVGFDGPFLESGFKYYRNTRIPTAFMGLGAALLAIAADHLKIEHYRAVLNAVRQTQCSKWLPACERLAASMKRTGSYPHSFHWY